MLRQELVGTSLIDLADECSHVSLLPRGSVNIQNDIIVPGVTVEYSDRQQSQEFRAPVLSCPVNGLSRTFDDSGPQSCAAYLVFPGILGCCDLERHGHHQKCVRTNSGSPVLLMIPPPTGTTDLNFAGILGRSGLAESCLHRKCRRTQIAANLTGPYSLCWSSYSRSILPLDKPMVRKRTRRRRFRTDPVTAPVVGNDTGADFHIEVLHDPRKGGADELRGSVSRVVDTDRQIESR